MTERILVVGAGAIGGVTAAHLTRGGHAVVVLDADTQHTAALRSPGLRLEELDGATSTIPIDAVSDAIQLSGRFDFAVVTVKSLAIEAALVPLVKNDLVDAYVSLGNGLVQQVVESVVGDDRLIVGLVEWGATNLGPGHVQQTTRAPMVIGEVDGRHTERLDRLAEVLRSVAEVKISSSITGQVWSKLLLNSTFSGLGAVGGCLYRDIVTHPDGREVALRLWTEGYDVASALGMELGPVFGASPHEFVVHEPSQRPAAEASLDRLMVRAGATKASMLQDLQRSRRTEVDVINGGVVSAAREAGRRAPLNAELTRIVHECEQGLTEPGPETFARLLAVVPDGKPQLTVASDTWVAPTAVLIGDVTVGQGASVWFGAVARADLERIVVGEHTNIQDGSILHADPGFPLTIGDRVSVGHGAVLHGCRIGDDVLVGMRSTILNGARVGAGSLVAAGAVVLEGADIPPRSLVAGVPARVRREVTDEEFQHILTNGRTYSKLSARYAAGDFGLDA